MNARGSADGPIRNRIGKSYSELVTVETFAERLAYLRLPGTVGESTFGSVRFLNQDFYRSPEWKQIRREIILRDNGCDLGCKSYEIVGRILIHHIDPVTKNMTRSYDKKLLDPNNLISCSLRTHQAIHYGQPTDDTVYVPQITITRKPNDTKLW